MSSKNKPASRGGKGAKGDKSHKAEKIDTGKSTEKQQKGGGDNVRSKADDPGINEKVKLIMDMTHRSEAEVCSALHDCDNDVEMAANMLFENNTAAGEWETTIKKKKNRQPSASKAETKEDTAGEEWNENNTHNTEKEKPRNKTGGPPRLHGRHNDSRGWKGREKQENERNLEEGGRSDHRERRGRSGGPTRGGGGARGRGGGRAGGRFPPRGNRGGGFSNNRPIDTWDSNTWDNSTANTTNHIETWDDLHTDEWSAEEYTGSLADTKVFTPSVPPDQKDEMKTGPQPGTVDVTSMGPVQMSQALDMRNQLGSQPTQMPSQSPVPMVTTLNAAQTQYLSQLTQQTSENMKAAHQQYASSQAQAYSQPQSYNNSTVPASQQQYSNTQQYGNTQGNSYVNTAYPAVNNSYGAVPDAVPTQQSVRTKTQRARVPPPSKIPASAVEMPGDLKSIGCLDLQFGAMDIIGDNNSFDSGVGDTSKYGNMNASGMENTSATQNANMDIGNTTQNSSLDAYSPSKPNTQSSISSALTQSLSNTDSIPQTSEHISVSYNTAPRSSAVSSSAPTVTPSALDMSKQAQDTHSYSQSSSYNSYQGAKSSTYQAPSYNSSSYSGNQATTTSYVSNQPNNYVNSNAVAYNTPAGGNSYQSSGYSSSNSYQGNTSAPAFPSITQANSYPANNQGYQPNASQSVYGANTGLNNSSSYGNSTSNSAQYNSYNSSTNHKLGKDSSYESSVTVSSSAPSSTSNPSVSTTSLSLTQTTATGTKVATTLAKNSSSAVSNIPPGVPPVMSTPYIINQGIPYFQQPMYTYEDMQLIQQRIPPHMTASFYDMSYQTPTTMAAVRDGALATYSMSDARFTRTDNNASPVPSTLSQQSSTLTQGHQAAQPMLTQTAGPYFFAPWQPSYQISAVYPQMPTATNAHGTTNSTQYAKPGTYGSGYGSGYDALTPSQDYSKAGYVGNAQGQNKGSGGNASSTGSTSNDLSSMYGKSHTALGKVNSYDKQGFHSGTPPPFTGALHGNQSAGLAPSGTGFPPQMYIPAMPHQQHHSTPLMHQPLHPMDVRHQGRRMDSSNTGGQRSQASNAAKTGAKQGYPTGYWNQS